MNIEQLLSTLDSLAQNDNTLHASGRPTLSISTEAGRSGFCVSETVYDAIHHTLQAYVERELQVLRAALAKLDAKVDMEVQKANTTVDIKKLQATINDLTF